MKEGCLLYRRRAGAMFNVEDTETGGRKISARRIEPKPPLF